MSNRRTNVEKQVHLNAPPSYKEAINFYTEGDALDQTGNKVVKTKIITTTERRDIQNLPTHPGEDRIYHDQSYTANRRTNGQGDVSYVSRRDAAGGVVNETYHDVSKDQSSIFHKEKRDVSYVEGGAAGVSMQQNVSFNQNTTRREDRDLTGPIIAYSVGKGVANRESHQTSMIGQGRRTGEVGAVGYGRQTGDERVYSNQYNNQLIANRTSSSSSNQEAALLANRDRRSPWYCSPLFLCPLLLLALAGLGVGLYFLLKGGDNHSQDTYANAEIEDGTINNNNGAGAWGVNGSSSTTTTTTTTTTNTITMSDGSVATTLKGANGQTIYRVEQSDGSYYFTTSDLSQGYPSTGIIPYGGISKYYTLSDGSTVQQITTQNRGILYKVIDSTGKVTYSSTNPKTEGITTIKAQTLSSGATAIPIQTEKGTIYRIQDLQGNSWFTQSDPSKLLVETVSTTAVLPNGDKLQALKQPLGGEIYRLQTTGGQLQFFESDPRQGGKSLETSVMPTDAIVAPVAIKSQNKTIYRVQEVNGLVWYSRTNPADGKTDVFKTDKTASGLKMDSFTDPTGGISYIVTQADGSLKFYSDSSLKKNIEGWTASNGSIVVPIGTEEFGTMFRIQKENGSVYYSRMNPQTQVIPVQKPHYLRTTVVDETFLPN